MRLYKYLKVFANLTKSEIYKLNDESKILVNGLKKGFLTDITDDDSVIVDGKIVKPFEYSYYLYYKPIGISSDITNKSNSYINNINKNEKLMPCGRLDKLSEGLMILTNDGLFINEIMSPNNHEKEYIVTLKNKITDDFIESLKKSYILDNRKTTPFIVKKIDDYNVSLILYEGIYHQIRRIVKLNNNYVANLKRVRISNYYIDDLKPGELRKIKVF